MVETITVACADPKGLILRVFEWVEVSEPSRSDSERSVKRAVEVGRIKLNGYWANLPPVQRAGAKAMPMAYGLTSGIDKELFERWYKANENNPLVKNRVVWAHVKADTAASMAKEREGELRFKGSDPLDATMLQKEGRIVPKDPRYPRPAPVAGLEPSVTTAER